MASQKTSHRTPPNTPRHATPRRPGRPAGRTTADGVIAGRESLLAAAEKLIRKNGPSTSHEAIAIEAGVTKPILYREVGDRDALLNALAERLAVRMAEAIQGLVAQASTPHRGLRSLVAGYLDFAARDRHMYLFVTAGGTRDDRVQQSLLLADGAVRQFAEPIAAYRAAHGADPAVATVWSYGFLGALHFTTLWWLRDQATDIDLVVDQITSLLWSGMGLEDTIRPTVRT
jgi:AcrR family transcriptional regulator